MIKNIFALLKIAFSICSFISVFYTVMELTYFLSLPKAELKNDPSIDPWLQSSKALLINMSLLTLFIVQHSFMATDKYKNAFNALGLQDTSRSLYATATAGSLWMVMKYWHPTNVIIWTVDLTHRPFWWLYVGVHTTAWAIIYVANICTDVTELLGLKQIYYSLSNLPDPSYRKSYQLQKLNKHMRHPSFLGFLLIFWLYPLMSLDRVLLSTILTAYMYVAWNTDGEDYNYQKYMYQRKYHELERLKSSKLS